jgi:mono/diheme cytochrome c family protein
MIFRVLALAIALLGAASATAVAQTPAPAAAAPDEARTVELYKQTCLACHMADGNAAMEPMNFVDGKWRHGSSVKEVAKVISEGVPGTAMMPFKTRFNEQEILALAKYVRAFDKTLKPEASAGTQKKKPAASTK